MPDCKLIRFSPVINGGFRITEMVHGVAHRIRQFDMGQAANELLNVRIGNNLPRATYAECVDDISIATCKEFGCDPQHCSDGTGGIAPVSTSRAGKPCGTCGRRKNKL